MCAIFFFFFASGLSKKDIYFSHTRFSYFPSKEQGHKKKKKVCMAFKSLALFLDKTWTKRGWKKSEKLYTQSNWEKISQISEKILRGNAEPKIVRNWKLKTSTQINLLSSSDYWEKACVLSQNCPQFQWSTIIFSFTSPKVWQDLKHERILWQK